MNKLKVMTVVGTRPEIIRLSRVIDMLDQHCDHVLVHTGQNYDYELNEIFFEDLDIRQPDFFLNASGTTSAETIGNVFIAIDPLLDSVNPEAFLVLGDTNSCMALIPAKRRKIPTFHLEAGNRCFDDRVPEEINRRIVDHTADVNLTYSNIAREYLISEGISPDLVIKVGSPMFEVLDAYADKIVESRILESLELEPFSYFVVSAHREENIVPELAFKRLINILNIVAHEYKLPVIVSTHPRTKNRIEDAGITLPENVRLIKPLKFSDYNKLQTSAKATLSDSGTLSEESSILNFPALNLREMHERPEGMEEASVMMVGLSAERVMQGLRILESQARGVERDLCLVHDYSSPNVSAKVLRIIYSYTDYVKRVVWKQ